MVALVTGAAGFIGYHVSRRLAESGEHVIGVDNLNDYYDTDLKRRRLAQLDSFPSFEFRRVDVADRSAFAEALGKAKFRRVIHLAAQANVRYALQNPHAYVEANVAGHLNILEFCRHSGVENLVYASSSSVYGTGNEAPFREDAVTDRPNSLYAATKKSQEMMSAVYADIFGIPQIGLRFFSVYGPWGRPDMAYWLFTDAIMHGRPIKLYNNGNMSRDFTYIDDVVSGVVAAADSLASGGRAHRIYNIGNSRPVPLMEMVGILEKLLGRKAELDLMPAQPGEVPVTFADVSAIETDLGFRPSTPLERGLRRFVDWFRRYDDGGRRRSRR
jgi:UDP-glucuronate 4-epimerase